MFQINLIIYFKNILGKNLINKFKGGWCFETDTCIL